MSYFGNIKKGVSTTAKGMKLTLQHLWNARIDKGTKEIHDEDFFELANGHVTLQYPHEQITVPDNGRYQLDCEIDDCIVCDKCAKICPVDCIEIEAIKSPDLIRHTSDGSPVRLHAAKFDIDMAKCCFCGLCTTVCPTDCLVMNSEYDYSTVDVTDLNFAFSNLSEEEAEEKRQLYDQFMAEKAALKAEAANQTSAADKTAFKPSPPKGKFVPGMKPAGAINTSTPESNTFKPKEPGSKKPIFKPSLKPSQPSRGPENTEVQKGVNPKSKAPFMPQMKPKAAPGRDDKPTVAKPLPFKPSMKPKQADESSSQPNDKGKTEKQGSAGKSFKPSMKPSVKAKEDNKETKPLPFKPTMKPVANQSETEAKPKSKTVPFKPTMKPKK